METSLTGKALDFGSREYGFESRVSNMHLINPYSHFLNQVALGSSRKRLSFDTVITSKTKSLASMLCELNIIRRFHRLQRDVYRVFPTFTRFRRNTRCFKIYTRARGRIVLSAKALRILNINSPHSYYVIETDRGLMTHKIAIKAGIGGMLLMVIR